jgi:hypothetical protein
MLVGIAVLVLGGTGYGFALRGAGVLALAGVPALLVPRHDADQTSRSNECTVDNPPNDWKATVRRWEFIDVF